MFNYTDVQKSIIDAVGKLRERFDADYWVDCDDAARFPTEFVQALGEGGWFGITTPEHYGGAGLTLSDAAVLMREISRMGSGASSAVHINIFGLQPVIAFGTEEQKQRMLPPLIHGTERACFGVTEPDAGLDTSRITTFAKKEADKYIIHGQKIWTSTAQEADKILLLARTTPRDQCDRPTDGMSIFYTDLDRNKIDIHEIKKIGRHAVDSNSLFIDGLEVPQDDLIGEEGRGFYHLLYGLNAERILVAAGCVGGGFEVLNMAAHYANDRVVFDRPIGKNQAIQHPLAKAWMELRAAELMCFEAAALYDRGESCGAEANAAKYLAAEALNYTAQRAMRTFGGYAFAKEYHVGRAYRDSVLALLAPASQELILCYIAEKVLGLPKSY